MKRVTLHLFLLAAFVSLPFSARAQSGFIQVSGTVVDPNGFPYSGGSTGSATISAALVPAGILSATLNGNRFATSAGPAALRNNGSFTLALADNTIVSPANTQWQFTVTGTSGLPWPIGRGSQSFTVTLTIHGNGTSQDISSSLNAGAPSLTNVCANSNLGSFSCGPAGGAPGTPLNSYQYNCAGSFCGGNLLRVGAFTQVDGALDSFAAIGVNNVFVPELLVQDGSGNGATITDFRISLIEGSAACGVAVPISLSCTDGTNISNFYPSFVELPLVAAPSLPASGQANLWIDSTVNILECELSNGASCMPTGPVPGNCASAGGACGSAGSGSVTVAASATTVTVDTTAVTVNSAIMLTFDSSLGAKLGVTCNATEPALYGVSARSAGVSFTITSTSPSVNPACFSYVIYG